jgi:hypothetical protein
VGADLAITFVEDETKKYIDPQNKGRRRIDFAPTHAQPLGDGGFFRVVAQQWERLYFVVPDTANADTFNVLPRN